VKGHQIGVDKFTGRTPKEAQTVKDVIKEVQKLMPGSSHIIVTTKGWGDSGNPDIIFCAPVKVTQAMVGKQIGLFVGIECKRDYFEKPTKLQKGKLQKLKDSTGWVGVIHGPYWPKVRLVPPVIKSVAEQLVDIMKGFKTW
jgi:hypothetical protein